MRVLILGAHGFLGQHVHRHLATQPGLELQLAPRSHELDLGRAAHDDWYRLLSHNHPNVVVNCAGRTEGDFDTLVSANVTLVHHLITAAAAQKTPPHLIHLGSAAEYGPAEQIVSETTPTHPISPYGKCKLAATHALLNATSFLPATILRVFNPIGAGQSESTLPGRAARQFQQALTGESTTVQFGDLSPVRDFIAVHDVARAVTTVLCSPSSPAVLNVGRGEGMTARDLIADLARISGYSGPITEEADGSQRSATVSRQYANVTRLRQLGWAPAASLEDALTDLWCAVIASTPSRQATA